MRIARSGLHFVGNVEGRDILRARCDVEHTTYAGAPLPGVNGVEASLS
jgi:fatty acid/phospholipid biosynthesis enzyme